MTDFIEFAIWPIGTLILTLLLTVPVWIRAISSRRWPTTTGRVLLSEGAAAMGYRDSSVLVPDIRYEYTVAGKEYQCRTVRFSYSAYRPADTVLRYHAGQDVTVYYSPRSPKHAVLEPGMQSGDVRRAMYPFLFFVALSLVIWLSTRFAPSRTGTHS